MLQANIVNPVDHLSYLRTMGGHHHTHLTDKPSLRYLRTALILNVTFTIIEIIGGFWTNSVAILTDAMHDLGDSISLGIALYFQWIAGRGKTKTFTYGFRRFSLLGALLNGFILFGGSIFLAYETLDRLLAPQDVKADGMILLAILGIAFNGAAYLQLKRGGTMNERMAAIHILEDALGWILVLIGSIVMYFVDVPIIDPILSILILGWILYNVTRNLKESFRIILQAKPKDIDIERMKQEMLELEGVLAVDDLHGWSLDGEYHVISTHVRIDPSSSMDEATELKRKIREVLSHERIEHITIELSTDHEPMDWHQH